jgi:hypothetical protein
MMVLSKFNTNLLAVNHSIIRVRTKYATVQKFPKFLLYIMTLVYSAKSIGFDMEFIFRGRLFIYIMNNKGPRIDPWGNPCFSVPQSEKMF